MVTLKTIAEEAGVSVMTVSRVINGVPGAASPETTQRVQEIAKARGYVPNSSARALVSKNSHMIAAILQMDTTGNPLADPYNARFLGALVNEVQAHGYDMMVRFVRSFDEAAESIRSWNADGAVFNGIPDHNIRQLQEQNPLPIVFTDCYTGVRRINHVGIDDAQGGELAAAHFIKKGHRGFAFLGYYQAEEGVMIHRLNAYRQALAEQGRPLPDSAVFLCDDTPATGINRCADALAAASGAITAVFAGSDSLALDLIDALRDRGLSVPGDISIIGFDDMPMATHCRPRLTTIAQDLDRKAKYVVDILFRHIADPAAPVEAMTLDVSLVERASVKDLAT